MSFIEDSGNEYLQSKKSTHGTTSEGSDKPSTSKIQLVKQKKWKSWKINKRRKAPSTSAKDNDSTDGENPDHPNQGNMSVMKLKKRDGARVYSKRHSRLHCPMQCHKMSRHLIHKHSSKSNCFSFKVKGNQKLHFDLIRNKGNRAHNTEVRKPGSGTLEKANGETCYSK